MAAVGVLLAGARLSGGPLALPAMSLVLLVAGLLFWALRGRGSSSAHVRLVAGALVALGFAGALLSDGDGALLQLERMHASSTLSAAK